MTKYDMVARLKEFREAAKLQPEQLDARINAPKGTVAGIESGSAGRVHPSLIALLAEALGAYGSGLDSAFDTRLNDAAAAFAKKALALALEPSAARRVWGKAFGASGYRGAIPDDIWDDRFSDEGGQKELEL